MTNIISGTDTPISPADVAKAIKPIKAPKVKAVLTKGQLRAVKNLAAAKRAKKDAESRIARWEAEVRAALGDAELGTTADGFNVVEVMHSKNSKYDRQVLTTRFPEAAEAAYVETPYTYVKVI